MKDLKDILSKIQIKEMKLVDRYLKTETTATGDIALPPDKASTDTPAGKASKKRKKNEKNKKLLIDEPRKKSGESG